MMYSATPHPSVVEAIKRDFPAGQAVELVEMDDPYIRMPPGLRGKVLCVDDMGTIHVQWENGSSLGVVFGVDRIRKI